MLYSRFNRGPVRERAHLDRGTTIGNVAKAQLAFLIPSPNPKGSVGLYGETTVGTRG